MAIIKRIMISKSFKTQIQTLYSLAAYQTTGIALPCTAEIYRPRSITNPSLTYKIDIAHRLYREYQKQDFKFSEKGVTPRMLAEQIAIFTHESDHCRMEIDSFGYILVKPTEKYLSQMKNNIITKDIATHYPIQIQNLKAQILATPNEAFLFSPQDLSLSSLRILFYLQLLIRKRFLLRECSTADMTKLIDLSSLNKTQIESLFEVSIIDLANCSSQIKTNSQQSIRGSTINLVKQLQLKKQYSCFSGCLRHNFISFYKKNMVHIDREDQILKFGQIFPKILLQQLIKIYPHTYKAELIKIMRHTLNFDCITPINLRQTSNLPVRPSCQLAQLVKHLTPLQQILLLMNLLGDDLIVECYNYLRVRAEKVGDEKPLLDKIVSTIELLMK